MRCLYPILIVLFLLSCKKHSTQQAAKTQISDKQAVEKSRSSKHDLVRLNIGTLRSNIRLKEEHLHGKFFDDRAEFYVIENPELYISNSRVKEVTLYFFDNKLCKKKFRLAKDISSNLIKSYGGFKFLSLNDRTKKIASSEKIVRLEEDSYIVNEKLDKYQMKWEKGEILLRYQMQKKLTGIYATLEEELSEYKFIFDLVENAS